MLSRFQVIDLPGPCECDPCGLNFHHLNHLYFPFHFFMLIAELLGSCRLTQLQVHPVWIACDQLHALGAVL